MPRLYRGVTHKFGAAFFEDSARLVPITRINASYPAYEIRDPDNVLVTSGIGTASTGSGFWETLPWTVPMDAPLSTPERGVSQTLADNNVPNGTARFWRVDWLIVDVAGRNVQWSENFEVLALPATISRDRSLISAVPKGAKQRVVLYADEAYDEISLTVANGLTPETYIHNITTVENIDLGDAEDLDHINRQLDGEKFVYWFEIPASTFSVEGDFQVVWTTKTDDGFEYDYQTDHVRCFNRTWLNYVKPLRMIIDKLQKQSDTFQYYTQSDCIEYLRRGLETLSAWHPANTNWSISTFPGGMMNPFLLVASAIHALQSQYLLEGELQANFSGQQVTLDYDHSSAIDGMLQKMQDYMNGTGNGNGFTPVKESWYRRSASVGIFGGRSVRWSGPGSIVYSISSGSFANSIQQLNALGLLP